MKTFRYLALTAIVILLAASFPVLSQAQTGSLVTYTYWIGNNAFPIPDIQVSINSDPPLSAVSDANGKVLIENIPVGNDYTVTIHTDPYYQPIAPFTDVAILENQLNYLPNRDNNPDYPAIPLYDIRIPAKGQVTDSVTGQGIAGVKLYSTAYGDDVYDATTDSDGFFTFKLAFSDHDWPKRMWERSGRAIVYEPTEQYISDSDTWIDATFIEYNETSVTVNYELTPKTSTYYVSTTGNDITGDGSQAHPFQTIQKGIDACVDGDTVLVGDGIYTGTGNYNNTILDKSITVKSENGPDNCIIDCENISNSYGFYLTVYGDYSQGIIEGFTIKNSTRDGGIRCRSADDFIHILRNNIITNCASNGIWVMGSLVRIENCLIKNCDGDGIYGEWANVFLDNTIISENKNGGVGVTDWYLYISNSLIYNNSGFGVRKGSDAEVKIINSTLAGNEQTIFCQGNIQPGNPIKIINSILWSDAQYEMLLEGYFNFNVDINISNSDIRGGIGGITPKDADIEYTLNWLEGNINMDPMFKYPASDFHLSDMSPCIGAGAIGEDIPKVDIEGNTRGIPPDIGAYENPLDNPIQLPEMSIAQAASYGLMNPYCYTWDGYEYVPVSPWDTDEIQEWEGFWVVVSHDLDLMIPNPPLEGAPFDENSPELLDWLDAEEFTYVAEPDVFHLISPPCLNNLVGDLGTSLGHDMEEKMWRVSKWNYLDEVYKNYQGADLLEPFAPGRGYFLQHIYDENKSIGLTGTRVLNLTDHLQYHELKLPSNGDPYTFHMAGNPFWFNIKWSDCMVRVPMTDALPLAKPALVQDETESWYIGLALVSDEGSVRDTYNRAGVLLDSGVDPELLCAFDMTPPGDYVRLFISDPSKDTVEKYSYDYRESGLDEYVWQVELTTTYNNVDAAMNLSNFEDVPENYSFSLMDEASGETIELSGDKTINIELVSGVERSYILSAHKQAEVVEVEEDMPATFGITGIYPNPFNPVTTIQYSLEKPGDVTLNIYNLNGQLVETLTQGFENAGMKDIVWNARGHASGVYIVSLSAEGEKDFRKITLIK